MAEEEKPENFNDNISENIQQELQDTFFAKEFGGEYSGSRLQFETYRKLQESDKEYIKYINNTYGSYENYLKSLRVEEEVNVFDPNSDYIIDVQIVTEDKSYRTDHISPDEVIMEALTGVCTVIFMKVDGSVGRITGTLEGKYIPSNQMRVRAQVFSPQKGDRIIMWDINKQDWRSFYMERVIKFVRDDTVGLE